MATKSILTSKTFWGAIITLFTALFPTIAAHFGVTDVNTVAVNIVTVLSTIFTVYGRMVAWQSVSIVPPKK